MALTPPVSDTDHTSGPADAPLELVMYGDFQCPYCIAAHPIVERVRRDLDGDLRFVFRHFPLNDIHPLAESCAEATEAGDSQGAFWELYRMLYESRGRGIDHRSILRHATALGLDLPRFTAEWDGGSHRGDVDEDVDSGRRSGVMATPAFFLNGVRHDGSFDVRSLRDGLAASGRGSEAEPA